MKNLKILFAISILIIIAACSKESDTPIPPAATANLLITNISPTNGPKNTAVTITGTGFSTTTASNAVTINGKVCPIINSNATQLTITIPPSAGSGKLKVTIGSANAESNNFDFVVTTTVSTIAGSDLGNQDGQGTNAQFNIPIAITIDVANNLYVTDLGNHRIRKISPTGFVTTIAGGTFGFANGQSILAKFSLPNGLTFDTTGNLIVADEFNNKIRIITTTGFVNTIAGTTRGFADDGGDFAKFDDPTGVAIDAAGIVYVADDKNGRIRKIATNRAVTTFAGNGNFGSTDGQGTAASFASLEGITIDLQGNLFVTDNDKIRKISPTGLVTTIAGSATGGLGGFVDGQGALAKFSRPIGIVADALGNLFVADTNNNKIRKISPTGLVTTIAGSTQGFNEGNATTAQFRRPNGITVDSQGNLFVADSSNHKIRKITFD